jgi:hypothetical protein
MWKTSGVAAAAVAALALAGAAAAPAAAATSGSKSAAVARGSQHGGTLDRNVRRTPARLSAKQAAAFGMDDNCKGQTLPIVCDIAEPTVNQISTVYPFSFLPGDHVVVQAGGCVQTGGHGKTWKRYVDPSADNDSYHGLITIQATTGELQRLVEVVGRPLVVGGSGRGTPLTLGYEDDGFFKRPRNNDGYGDNGYYARNDDNGTGNQCLGLGNAFVHIVVS